MVLRQNDYEGVNFENYEEIARDLFETVRLLDAMQFNRITLTARFCNAAP